MYFVLNMVFIKLLNRSQSQVRIGLPLCTSRGADRLHSRWGAWPNCDLTMRACVCTPYSPSRKEALRDCCSEHLPLPSVPGWHGVYLHQDPCCPSPPSAPAACPPAPFLADALGTGKVLPRCQATTPADACKPVSCGMPGQVPCVMPEGREGLLAGGTLAFSGWPAASPRATHLRLGAGGTKDISLQMGFSSLGRVV